MDVTPFPLRRSASFRRLIASRAVGQMAQNALLYTLLIVIVEKTGSSIHTTLLVAAFIVPSILLGVPAGALAEGLPRRTLLVTGYLARAVIVVALLLAREDVWTIYLLVLIFSSVGQLTGPAESAAIPAMVEQEQVAAANSYFVLSVMLGQVGGAVILAPFLFKLLGDRAVMVVVVALFAVAAALVGGVSGMTARVDVGERRPRRPSLGSALAQGWRILQSSRRAFMAITYLTIAAFWGRSLAVLAPQYTKDVLGIETENAVFVVAPAAIGALVALLLTPLLAKLIGAGRAALLGFALLALGLLGFGLVVYVRVFLLNHLDLGISFVEERVGVSSVITVSMLLAIPVGLAMTMVTVAAKAVLNQEAPAGTQARVFATQSALSDALSLLPLFVVGAVAELVGTRAVLIVAVAAGVLAALYLALPPGARRRNATAAR